MASPGPPAQEDSGTPGGNWTAAFFPEMIDVEAGNQDRTTCYGTIIATLPAAKGSHVPVPRRVVPWGRGAQRKP